MTPLEIKIAMMRAGVTQREIARKLGVSKNSVFLVVNKGMTSKRIMEEIAKAIGLDRSVVFPKFIRDESEVINDLTTSTGY